MADLTADMRNRLKSSAFGLPGARKYPMPDKAHAVNAKARATQMVDKGKLSAGRAAKIKTKANKILTGTSQDINAPGNNAISPSQNDINNWKSKPVTGFAKSKNDSQGSGKASRTGEANVRDPKQPKVGGTEGGIRRGRNSINSISTVIRDH